MLRCGMRGLVLGALLWSASAAHAEPKVPQYSIWVGSYTCLQGITWLRLTIETGDHGGPATGHFQFGPHTDNPSVPKGDYWMKGTARPGAHGELEVMLVPDKWVSRPNGYVMVGLTAKSDREQRAMSGTIDYASCTTLNVTRVTAEAAP